MLFALLVLALPPAVFLCLEWLAGLVDARVGWGVHLGAVALLAALLSLQALRDADSVAAVPVAAALGGAGALLYGRGAAVRSVLTLVLAPVPAVVLGLFLLGSPVREIVLPGEAAGASAPVPAGSSVPIVVVVFDEFSLNSLLDEQGDIDAERYPGFAALAAESTWYPNAATVSAWTTNAIPAMLTGVYPERGVLPVYAEYPGNAFTLVQGTLRLNVWESLTELCPTALCPRSRRPFGERLTGLAEDAGLVYLHRVLPADARARLPSVEGIWGEFLESAHERTSRRATAFQGFLASLDRGGEPALSFAHVMFPHIPYEFLPSGHRYDSGGAELPGFRLTSWGHDAYLVAQAEQRYLLQVGYVDRLVGDLLARLRSTGLWADALVVVTADHGVSFRPGDRRRALTETNLEDIAFVPLFVKWPGQRGRRVVEAAVQTVDVLPTIADVLGLEPPWKVEGRSLRAPGDGRRFVLLGDRRTWRIAPTELAERRLVALQRQLGLVDRGLYGIGPHPELLGRAADTLPAAAGFTVQIDQAVELERVDLRSGYVPARLTGRLSGPGAPRELAVGVNGRIEATTRSYLEDGEERFSVLVPERAFRQGQNDVLLVPLRT